MKTTHRSTAIIAATLLIATLFASSAAFATSIGAPSSYPAYKPYAYIYGTATNTILSGQSPMNYNPSTGIESTLPFNYSTGKLAFPFANVAFKNNLLNGSVQGTTEYSPSGKLSLSSVQLLQSNGINYIAMTVTNSSNLAASTAYTADTSDVLRPTIPVTSTTDIVLTAQVTQTCTTSCLSFATLAPFIILHVVDTGGLMHAIELTFAQIPAASTTAAVIPQTPASSETVSYGTGSTSGTDNAQYYTIQANLGHILSLESYTWTPSVLNGITYGFTGTTGTTLGKNVGYSAQIVNAFVAGGSVSVSGPAGATLFNGTRSTQSFSQAVTRLTTIAPLTISNAAWTQINSAAFPFVYAPKPAETLYPDQLQIQYSWNFTVMPTSPSTLTFSGVDMNMSMNSLTPNMFSNIFVNGASYTTTIASWVGTTVGQLVTNLQAGTSYYLQSLITYTASEYDGVTQVPSLYQNPAGWLEANFWYIIVAFAGFFGLGTAVWATKAREIRVPK